MNELLKLKTIFYGLTEDEVTQSFIYYTSNKYSIKGVNTSLRGLKKFIIDNNLSHIIRYYIKIPIAKFKVRYDIDYDEEYNMIGVEIPFKFKFKRDNLISDKG